MIDLARRDFLGGAAALAGAALLARPAHAGGPLTVTIYGGRWEKFWREALIPPFEKETGGTVTLDVGLSKAFAANLMAAGVDQPPYDVTMFGEIFANLLRGQGYFDTWTTDKVPNLADLYPIARNGDVSVIAMISPIAIAYRTDLVKTKPQAWTDLWDNPEFKGKVGMYQIGNPAAYMFLMMMSKIYGGSPDNLDAGFKQIEKLQPFTQVDFSGTMAVQLSRGEVIAAPVDIPEIVAQKRRGAPVDFVIPKEGVFMFEQTFNLAKASKNKEMGYLYLNYLLRADVQEKLMREYFVSPVNKKVMVPEELRHDIPITGDAMSSIVTFDWKTANERRDAVAERWNRTFR